MPGLLIVEGRLKQNESPSAGWRYWPNTANTFDELFERLRAVGSRAHWQFRGEPKWFDTGCAAIGRHLANNAPNPDGAEAHRLAHFQEMAESQLTEHESRIAKDAWGWLVLAQHHGMPTRLLDWTTSAWVAAYFAARDDREEDGYIWAFDPRRVYTGVPDEHRERLRLAIGSKKIEEYYHGIRGLPACLVTVGMRGGTRRMVAQRSVYSIGCPATLDHRAFIGNACQDAIGSAELIRVPKQVKRTLMQELWAMNIHAASLFPGLDGAGRSIIDSMRFGLAQPENLELPTESE